METKDNNVLLWTPAEYAVVRRGISIGVGPLSHPAFSAHSDISSEHVEDARTYAATMPATRSRADLPFIISFGAAQVASHALGRRVKHGGSNESAEARLMRLQITASLKVCVDEIVARQAPVESVA